MNIYDVLCLVLCIFAVFGGYIALRIAANAALRRASRRADHGERGGSDQGDCGGCTGDGCVGCPEKRTDEPCGAKRD